MVENLVKTCRTSLKCKNPRLPKAEMRLDEQTDFEPQDTISVDVASMAPSPSANTCFLVMVDVVTKFYTTVACKDQHAETLITAFWSKWFSIFGVPKQVISNQGRNLVGKQFEKMCLTRETCIIARAHIGPT